MRGRLRCRSLSFAVDHLFVHDDGRGRPRPARTSARSCARGGVEPPGDVYARNAGRLPGVVCGDGRSRGALAARRRSPMVFAGATVFAFGKALKWWAIAALGPLWTFRVIVVPGMPLVAAGPYRFLRHPNYLGVLGELVGTLPVDGRARLRSYRDRGVWRAAAEADSHRRRCLLAASKEHGQADHRATMTCSRVTRDATEPQKPSDIIRTAMSRSLSASARARSGRPRRASRQGRRPAPAPRRVADSTSHASPPRRTLRRSRDTHRQARLARSERRRAEGRARQSRAAATPTPSRRCGRRRTRADERSGAQLGLLQQMLGKPDAKPILEQRRGDRGHERRPRPSSRAPHARCARSDRSRKPTPPTATRRLERRPTPRSNRVGRAVSREVQQGRSAEVVPDRAAGRPDAGRRRLLGVGASALPTTTRRRRWRSPSARSRSTRRPSTRTSSSPAGRRRRTPRRSARGARRRRSR